MILVEQHIIKRNHKFYDECNKLTFASKNLYNQALYNVRQFYFERKKFLNYFKNYHITKGQEAYKELPTKVSCQTIKMVDQNFKSFFQLLKNKNVKNKLPKYLDKKSGRFMAKYPKQALGLRTFKKNGAIKLSKTNIEVKTNIKNWDQIKEVRIIPKGIYFTIEVVYDKPQFGYNPINNKVASIDLGLNNLATVAFNCKQDEPFIISGKPVKSINQFYNKRLATFKSELIICNKQKSSRKIKELTFKRNNKIKDYLHKASNNLVNQLVSNGVQTIIIGKNINMKQDINIGKRNNQNFVQSPIFRFADMIKYKAELYGINVQFQEEAYTSKTSFLDMEPIKKQETYQGKRIKRGLFKSKNGTIINADLNGAYNILRKAIPNAFADGIEGFGVNPKVLHCNL